MYQWPDEIDMETLIPHHVIRRIIEAYDHDTHYTQACAMSPVNIDHIALTDLTSAVLVRSGDIALARTHAAKHLQVQESEPVRCAATFRGFCSRTAHCCAVHSLRIARHARQHVTPTGNTGKLALSNVFLAELFRRHPICADDCGANGGTLPGSRFRL